MTELFPFWRPHCFPLRRVESEKKKRKRLIPQRYLESLTSLGCPPLLGPWPHSPWQRLQPSNPSPLQEQRLLSPCDTHASWHVSHSPGKTSGSTLARGQAWMIMGQVFVPLFQLPSHPHQRHDGRGGGGQPAATLLPGGHRVPTPDSVMVLVLR